MLFWDHTSEKPESDTVTIGHENTGYIVAMGKDVKGFKLGDKVGCLGCSYACCKSPIKTDNMSNQL
jgi:D-arabinose 1-dehydrogenase-like Zn-dependent alcohol dehydrogenase